MSRYSLFAVLLLAGCGGSGSPVDFVVPAGFTGTIWLVLDPSAPDVPLRDGRYQVVVPADGLLRIRSFDPFEQFHQQTARFSDDVRLPQVYETAPGTVAR